MLILCSQQFVNAQDADKIVTITVSGSGKTQDEAKQSALRSAIEQAFGAFISSKTEILNDQIVADQMSSVASGNIQSYQMLNESQLPDGTWGVTLKAIVSVSKLTSFVQSKGIAIEINGGLFALNIQQQILNEQAEVNAIAQMVGLIHEPMQTAFDYSIVSGDPKSVDATNKIWEIPIKVTAKANANLDFCINYFINTLSQISLKQSEVEEYKKLNKNVYQVFVMHKKNINKFYLRNINSLKSVSVLKDFWQYYLRLFSVKFDSHEYIGNGERRILLDLNFSNDDFYSLREYPDSKIIGFKFPSYGQDVETYSWNEKLTLLEIEKLSVFTVKPSGIRWKFKHGGFVIKEPSEGAYKIGLGVNKDNIINVISEDYPAYKAGLRSGDKIVSVDGIPFIGIENIIKAIKNGNKINITAQSKDKIQNIEVLPIYANPSKGLVASLFDLGKLNWIDASVSCNDLNLNGYTDWYLPNKDELQLLLRTLYFQCHTGGEMYWSCSSENDFGFLVGWNDSLHIGKDSKAKSYYVRAIREF